jgi:hypothetical protein
VNSIANAPAFSAPAASGSHFQTGNRPALRPLAGHLLLFFYWLFYISTEYNRIHRSCANVEGNLNYTKFSYFALHPPAEKGCGQSANRVLLRFLHIFAEACSGPAVQNAVTSLE